MATRGRSDAPKLPVRRMAGGGKLPGSNWEAAFDVDVPHVHTMAITVRQLANVLIRHLPHTYL
jgi:hypothetical protein